LVRAAVDDELRDSIALEDDRRARPRLRLWGACFRPEHELALFCEQDPGPGAPAAFDQGADDRPEDIVGVATPADELVDLVERIRGCGQNAVPSNSAIAWRKPAGTGTVVRSWCSISTRICFAVTIKESSPSPSSR